MCVVALAPGVDPADDPTGFERKLAQAEPYRSIASARDRPRGETASPASRRVRTLLDSAPDSPERQDAWRYANDKLGMTVQLRAGGSTGRAAAPGSASVLDAGANSSASALAASPSVSAAPAVAGRTRTSSTSTTARIARTARPPRRPGRGSTKRARLLAELDAHADADGIGEATGTELLLRLRERQLQLDLRSAPIEQRGELRDALAKLRERAASISA